MIPDIFSCERSRGECLSALSTIIPINGYGLPEGIYRPDLLPDLLSHSDNITAPESVIDKGIDKDIDVDIDKDIDILNVPTINAVNAVNTSNTGKYAEVAQKLGLSARSLELIEDEIDAAYILLDYSEGFPTFSGVPFWIQMSYEPPDAYLNFEAYLRQPAEQGGIRQLYTLKTLTDSSMELLREQAALYYWHFRAKAYDTFNIIFRRKERERLALEVENEQLLVANRLMDICSMYLDANSTELVETLSPKNFVELLKTASALQRISVGLPANGPSPSSKENPTSGEGTSLEVILRNLAQSNVAPKTDAVNNPQAKTAEQLNAMRSLLHNPDVLNLAQELIVRVNAPSSQGS